MSWKTENAVRRIYNSFKRLKSNIYKEDIEALKTVADALDNAKKSYVNDNALFAKLLAIQLRQNIEHFRSIDLALKVIDEDLNRPIDFHLQLLHKSLNQVEFDNYLKSIGLNVNFITTRQEQEQNDKIIKEKANEISKRLCKDWSYEQIEKSFYNSANDFLQNIKNYS